MEYVRPGRILARVKIGSDITEYYVDSETGATDHLPHGWTCTRELGTIFNTYDDDEVEEMFEAKETESALEDRINETIGNWEAKWHLFTEYALIPVFFVEPEDMGKIDKELFNVITRHERFMNDRTPAEQLALYNDRATGKNIRSWRDVQKIGLKHA
jgi:hypothetical protein